MCGIIGYTGKHSSSNILIDGLKRLEYRGYDSSGIAVIENNNFQVIKKTGRVENISKIITQNGSPKGHIGIGHTRWATHGGVTDNNAHPHVSSDGKFSIIHNGIIENYAQIKAFLLKKGYTFLSETDTEVLVNLIAYHYAKEPTHPGRNRFVDSVRKSLMHVEGAYGIAVLCVDHPTEIVAARRSSPLILGIGEGENMVASDISAFVTRTQNVVYLKDGEIAHLTDKDFSIITTDQQSVEAKIHTVDWDIEAASLGEFSHFMEKEIFEQPTAVENALRGRFSEDGSTALFGGLNITPQQLRHIDRIIFCACGTAWHTCLIAEYMIERYARIPVEVEYASEFRYKNAPLDKNTLVFIVSQSGETIDTLEALRESQRKGFKTLAIVNTVGSTIAREADGGIYQHAGPEIGVASTKAFTSQLAIVALIALYLGRMHDMSVEDGIKIVKALKQLPDQIRSVLKQKDHIRHLAKKYAHYKDMLFLGRQMMFPIALEGALKLKEVSYIHAEAYPAGEMKHGPIALISEQCPCVCIAPEDGVYAKTLSNIQELKARKAPMIAIIHESSEFPDNLADDIITIPPSHPITHPILATIPLQLFAYYVTLELGHDVDKPRNLAKSVTVE